MSIPRCRSRATAPAPAARCCSSTICTISSASRSRQIIGNAPGLDSSGNPIDGACLRGVYQNLTGDISDPFPYFASLLAAAYPPDQVSSIPGPNTDDPWPLGSLSFLGAKNIWGYDEITDIIAKGGTYTDGFYLALDGFSQNIVGGTLPSLPTIAFGGVKAALSATPPTVTYQSTNPKVPQQILFAYDVNFAQPLGTFSATARRRRRSIRPSTCSARLFLPRRSFSSWPGRIPTSPTSSTSYRSNQRQRSLAKRGPEGLHCYARGVARLAIPVSGPRRPAIRREQLGHRRLRLSRRL